jgi:catechol 2,3-dioxygenase-like lactoylglutathione lyase family enzyme
LQAQRNTFLLPAIHDQALAFYTEKLGFRLLTDQPFDNKQRWTELGISGTETRIVLFHFEDGSNRAQR